ncbi:hypothetical protein KTJ16_14040 [Acinetobacter bereziniae]|jgi:hypothetical protein|uniref:ABC-three component system protein n=1 Tax=Acinetobacter bereziniae TaxID=106648 RepID=UPI0018FF4924|nr:ABC-three component system protein [Acinetobacter bereziniae]MBJ8422536.1 hypothetical protein [Acinetobacter bereziniae]MCU4542287.1 hypothetical protein [Acinetobacter bereziniae]MCU4627669.1 hypothetical protein [Acinetobacter bereziniae]
MLNVSKYQRPLLALDDKDLEIFIHDWVTKKIELYVDHDNFTGAGDMGRDVVGFLTDQRHEGAWHNYQCKQYSKKITRPLALLEIGKILYYASQKHFIVPEKYFFIAPKGINRPLETLINNPSQFKMALINEWTEHCEGKIIKNSKVPLNDEILEVINKFDFSNIKALQVSQLLSDPDINSVLFKWFKHDPGEAPKGDVPLEVENTELEYVSQLVHAYGERAGVVFESYKEIEDFDEHFSNFKIQRRRFYDAEAFQRYYRDNTAPQTVQQIKDDIFDGIIDNCTYASYKDTLEKIIAILGEVIKIQLSGDISSHTTNSVRQGLCHHLVNERKIKWII